MPQGLGAQLGLGGGRAATSSGAPGASGPSYEYDLGTIDGTLYGLSLTPNLHLDASPNDGVGPYNTGTTLATNGQTVETWGDRSGNDNDFTEATNQPLWEEAWATWAGNRPAVYFDGVTDILSDADFFSGGLFSNKDATMVIVHQPNIQATYSLTSTGTAYNSDRTANSSPQKDYSSAFLNDRVEGYVLGSLTRPARGAATYGIRIGKDPVRYGIYFNKRLTADLTQNMGTDSAYDITKFATKADDSMDIGCGGLGYPFKGWIAEVLVFNAVLTDEDWDAIHDYVDAKYKVHQYDDVTGTYDLSETRSTTVTPVVHFSAQSNVFKTDGTAPADGEEVALWTDKARGYHATEGNPGVFATNAINTDKSGIYFDGVDDFMEIFNLQLLGDFSDFDGTVIMLFEPESDTIYQPIGFSSTWARWQDGAAYIDTLRTVVLSNPATTGFFTSTGAQIATIVSDQPADTYEMYNGGGSDVFDAAQSPSATVNWTYDSLSKRIAMVSNGTGYGSYGLKGWVYEVLIFDEPLSNANLNAVGNYFNDVYGVTYVDIT